MRVQAPSAACVGVLHLVPLLQRHRDSIRLKYISREQGLPVGMLPTLRGSAVARRAACAISAGLVRARSAREQHNYYRAYMVHTHWMRDWHLALHEAATLLAHRRHTVLSARGASNAS